MSKKYDPSIARRHWVYDRKQLKLIFDVSESTITNWLQRGLVPIDGKKAQLFAGYKVRQFLTELRWPHGRTPENGRLFCHACFGFKPLTVGTIQTSSVAFECLKVTGECVDCQHMLQTVTKANEIGQIFSASASLAQQSPDGINGRVSRGLGRNAKPIPPESSSSNLRWLYHYRVFLEAHEERVVETVDEHLRTIGRMSAHLKNRPFEAITISDAISFKKALRQLRDDDRTGSLSHSTVTHSLMRCGMFFRWLSERPGIELDPHLPGYFNVSRNELRAAASSVKGTSLTFDQATSIFAGMPNSNPIEIRNRAIIALFICTGIRVAALRTLRGKHVNLHTRWINQDPREVETKLGKHIRTYCLNLGPAFLDAMLAWAHWRAKNGFGTDDAFFLPDRYIQANGVSLGYRPASSEPAICWQSVDPVQQIVKCAARAAGFDEQIISSHDFRKVIHPFLAKRGGMTIAEEVALQLNFGHEQVENIRKHYALMQEDEREELLDELCRRALSSRSELELYLEYERKTISETDSDFQRARDIYQRNLQSGEMS